jgi:AcrR family transcriptional regulator
VRTYSPTQLRTLDAALDLFAEHGVGGTSFQMIADAVGVTKAAIYHQFRTKEAILRAVLEVTLAGLERALDVAEGEGDDPEARVALLDRLIDAAVQRRRAVGTLQNDPVLVRMLAEQEASAHLWNRLYTALLGGPLDEHGRVRAAVLSAAIGSVGHPFVADVDDDTLKADLRELAARLLES